MKTVLIVDIVSLNRAPYISIYKEIIGNNDINVKTLTWDRTCDSGIVEHDNDIVYGCKSYFGGNKVRKVFPLVKYIKFVRQYIQNNKFDKIIVINTLMGVLLSDILVNRYKNKYIFDIRDYTHENIKIYKWLEDKVIKNSFQTVISSNGFKSFLNQRYTYQVVHNMPSRFLLSESKIDFSNKKIVIGFVGSVRYEQENLNLLSSFANDNRFKFVYIGEQVKGFNLEEKCKKNKIENVEFKGAFENSHKEEIYKQIDVINSLYGVDSLEVTTALPNRLYDAVLYNKPIIASKGTYLAEIIEKYNLGLGVDLSSDNLQYAVADFLFNFDYKKFEDGRKRFLDVIAKEQKEFRDCVATFLK